MCESEMRRSHLVGYEMRPDSFYERRWESENFKRVDDIRTETVETSQTDQSTTEQGM